MFLNSNNDQMEALKPDFCTFMEHFQVEANQSHVNLIPSVLWILKGFDLVEEFPEATEKLLTILNNQMDDVGSLSFTSTALLNQVLNDLDTQTSISP